MTLLRPRFLSILALGLTLAACGDDGGDEPSTTSSPTGIGSGGGTTSSTGTGTGSGVGGGGEGGSVGQGGANVPGDVLFFDDFEYTVERDTGGGEAFLTEGGWGHFKDMRVSNPGAGGYLYTVTAIDGFSGAFPGATSSRVLCLESRAGTEAPEVNPGHTQTDFYLQYGDESSAVVGTLPGNLWVQFWIYQQSYGSQMSQYERSDKWLYPTRDGYPGSAGGSTNWLAAMGTASGETDGSAWTELGPGPDRFFRVRAEHADFTGASEYPTNRDKMGHNAAPSQYVHANQWTLVKIHIDISGEQGTFEVWLRPQGGTETKVTEWIGGGTTDFTWPIPANLRDGHRLLRMPTTMNNYDSWTYLDDFALATGEDALPTYGG